MDWFSEFEKAFSKAAARVVMPAIWLPNLLVSGVFTAGVTVAMFRHLNKIVQEGPGPQSGAIGLLGLAVILLTPAISSGLWGVSRVVAMDKKAGWHDFWSNTGTYYWRLVGLALLVGLAAFVVVGFTGYRTVTYGTALPFALPGFASIFYVVGRYFSSMVVPAMVAEDKPAFQSIGLGVSFAWKHASIVVPVVAVDLGVGWLLSKMQNSAFSARDLSFPVGGELVGYLAVLALGTVVTAFFRLLYLGIYIDRLPVALGPVEPPMSEAVDTAEGETVEPAETTAAEDPGEAAVDEPPQAAPETPPQSQPESAPEPQSAEEPVKPE